MKRGEGKEKEEEKEKERRGEEKQGLACSWVYAPVAARRLGPLGVVWDACVATLPSYAGVAPGNRWG